VSKINSVYAIAIIFSIVLLFSISFLIVKLMTSKNTYIFNKDSIAVVEVIGMIVDSTETIKQLHYAKDDDNIKAVVLRIDSPGGVVAPTQEIYES